MIIGRQGRTAADTTHHSVKEDVVFKLVDLDLILVDDLKNAIDDWQLPRITNSISTMHAVQIMR